MATITDADTALRIATRAIPGRSVTPVRDAVILVVRDDQVELASATLHAFAWDAEVTPCGNGRTALRVALDAFAG